MSPSYFIITRARTVKLSEKLFISKERALKSKRSAVFIGYNCQRKIGLMSETITALMIQLKSAVKFARIIGLLTIHGLYQRFERTYLLETRAFLKTN